VNLAGAEFGSALPGAFGTDYTFPTTSEVDYFMAKGMNTFRVGFKWERMQRAAYGALDATYFSRLDTIVKYATAKGATVILNPHNFARYYGSTVGSSQVPNGVFADFWKKLSEKYVSNARVMFNLVNEPHDINTEQWVSAANAAITAIRGTGAGNVIVVPGNGWTGAHSWTSTYYGTSNAVAMLNVKDSANNVLFEVHQYMDSDSSGGSGTCMSTSIGKERLTAFVKWLRDNGKKGFLGEFAGGDNATCKTAVANMLDFVHGSSDVLTGWTWWAGGPWWGDYKFALDPKSGQDRPQMAWLLPYLAK
jgi:endoglucanase